MPDKDFRGGEYDSIFTGQMKMWISRFDQADDDQLAALLNEIILISPKLDGVPVSNLTETDCQLLAKTLETRLGKVVAQENPAEKLIDLFAKKLNLIASRMKEIDDKKFKKMQAAWALKTKAEPPAPARRSRAEQKKLDNDALAGKVLTELLAAAKTPESMPRTLIDAMLQIDMDAVLPSTARALCDAANSIDIARVPTEDVQYFREMRQQWDNEMALMAQLQAGEHTAVIPDRAQVLADRAQAMGESTQDVAPVQKKKSILSSIRSWFGGKK